MIIRPIEQKDVDTIIELGREFHQESPIYSRFTYSEKRIRELANAAIGNPNEFACFVAEKDNKVIGLFAGYITNLFFSNDCAAYDIVLYVAPKDRDGRTAFMLVHAFEHWAAEKEVDMICLGVTAGIDNLKVAEMYRVLGYQSKDSAVLFKMLKEE